MENKLNDNKEYFHEPQEFCSFDEKKQLLSNEFFSQASEYSEILNEYSKNKELNLEKKKHIKKLKKMLYLVAGASLVVMMGKTLPIDTSYIGENPTETATDIEVKNPIEAATDVEVENTTKTESTELKDAEQNTETNGEVKGIIGSLSEYEQYGYAGANVIPVQKDGLWGAIDYKGNVLLEPTYEMFWLPPNDDGYTVFKNGDTYYIMDASGAIVYESGTGVSYVRITYDNIIYEEYIGELTENGNERKYVYRNLDGQIIYETEWHVNGLDQTECQPFSEGSAICYNAGNGSRMIYTIDLGGKIKIIDNEVADNEQKMQPVQVASTSENWVIDGSGNGGGGEGFNDTCAPCSPIKDNYYLELVDQGYFSLVNVHSNDGTAIFRPDEMVDCYLHLESDYTRYNNIWFENYIENGNSLYNYGTYGCLRVEYADQTQKYFLFDFAKVKNIDGPEIVESGIIASYDKIYFNDFPIILVCEDDQYFYIDYDGNVVSETYSSATPFNSSGYALVVKDKGAAYVIDENFNVVETLEGVNAVGGNMEIFLYENEEGIYYYALDK